MPRLKNVKSKSQFKSLAAELRHHLSLCVDHDVADLAKHAGVSCATYYRYLGDMGRMPLAVLIRSMDYLEIASITLEPRF